MAALNTLTLCLVIAAFAASGALLNGVAGGGALAASPGDHANLHVSEMQGESFEERAAQLAAQMTLAEKISQLDTNSPGVPRLGVTPFNWWQGAACWCCGSKWTGQQNNKTATLCCEPAPQPTPLSIRPPSRVLARSPGLGHLPARRHAVPDAAGAGCDL